MNIALIFIVILLIVWNICLTVWVSMMTKEIYDYDYDIKKYIKGLEEFLKIECKLGYSFKNKTNDK